MELCTRRASNIFMFYYKQITNQTNLQFVRLIHETENQFLSGSRNLQYKTLRIKDYAPKSPPSFPFFLSDWWIAITDKNCMLVHMTPNFESNVSRCIYRAS
jgi:hypothetical protein